MAFDKNSNGFTFGFAIAMVVVVGSVLALASMGLKPFQKANIEKEKKQNILAAIQVTCDRDEAPELFDQYVKQLIVLNKDGEVLEGDAFGVDVKKQYREVRASARTPEDVMYPLYICEREGETYYVIPMAGSGLWGPVWGFVALESDLNTIFGATFDHKTETPGLGAEINTGIFQIQFQGDKVYEMGAVKLSVRKGGGGNADEYGVDGITGGTITSKGVEEMLQRTLAVYQNYFASLNS
jgi:Na+-transporting NADH:ubiquinone oxidoreductase subunit C